MSEPLPNAEKIYKTPIYLRNGVNAYITREKDKDLQAYNKKRNDYMQKSINKVKEAGKYEEFKEHKKTYMKKYREKSKQNQNLENQNLESKVIEEIEIIN